MRSPACAESRERQKAFFGSRNHAQPGEPEKVAALIPCMAAETRPPLRITGSDALARLRDRLRILGEEVEAWAGVSSSIDLEP